MNQDPNNFDEDVRRQRDLRGRMARPRGYGPGDEIRQELANRGALDNGNVSKWELAAYLMSGEASRGSSETASNYARDIANRQNSDSEALRVATLLVGELSRSGVTFGHDEQDLVEALRTPGIVRGFRVITQGQ